VNHDRRAATVIQNNHDAGLPLRIKQWGSADYQSVWQAMQAFTDKRDAQTADEFWVVQHPPVFTLGRNAKAHHVLDAGDIPVVQVDRGGQVTYHGPGQLVVYTLCDLGRLQMGIKPFVRAIEQSIIALLAQYGIKAGLKAGAPGVYVDGAKIAALGLRVRRGCTYHGLALNVDMDLSPFERINPCGYAGMAVTQLRDLLGDACPAMDGVERDLLAHLQAQIGYNAGPAAVSKVS
jgi:lipoyl(octanoyl) transferase